MSNESSETKQSGFSISRLVPLLVLAAGLGAFFALGLNEYVNLETLKENRELLQRFVADYALLAALIYIGVYAVAVAFSIPIGAVATLTGGFLFGTLFGGLYTVIGATIGACAVFLAAKTALGDALKEKAGPTIKKMEAGFRKDAFSYLMVLRLVPLFPFWLVNLAPAFLGVPLRTYAIATFLGIIPATFVFASIGNGLGAIFDQGSEPDLSVITQPEVFLPILGLAALSLIPIVYKRFAKQDA